MVHIRARCPTSQRRYVMKIQLASVLVNDPKIAFKFYTEVLGFVERLYMPDMNLAIVASPEEPNGTGLLLEPNDNPIARTFQEGVYQQGLPVIVFGVADIHKEAGSASPNASTSASCRTPIPAAPIGA